MFTFAVNFAGNQNSYKCDTFIHIQSKCFTKAFDYTEGKRYTKLVKDKPLQKAGEVLPVVTYALDDERTTYISQEIARTATSSMMGSKSDLKRQTAPGTAG